MEERTNWAIETVFLATDFSETADLAFEHAVGLATRHGARLVVGHVVEPMPVSPYPLLAVPADGELAVREFAAERLASVAESARGSGLEVETRLATGAPGYELIELSKEAGADLFVIGTRGLTGFEHLLFGSTAEHVVRRARCPVLTVHPEDGPPRKPIGSVILPTDLSSDAAIAAEVFISVFDGGARPKVVLIFADQTPPYLEPFQHQALERWNQPDMRKDDIQKRMEPSVKRLRDAGFEVETGVMDGGPVDVVTAEAKARGADMVVMSTHGRSALVNVLLGRTAQRVVQHAPCPVLTVRPPTREVETEEH
jgi:nucleotide-binding universal stress UspA family protein